MLKERVDTGRTVEEAINRACEQLGYSRDQVQIDIISLPKKGFFGLMSSPAKVRVYVESSKAQVAAEYLGEVLAAMGLADIAIQVKEEGENAVLALSGEGLGVIIGRRGETMDALQYLSGLVANRMEGSYVRITIDSGNYREKREHTLEALARKLALAAVRTGRSSTLEPMNPYERRIIHAAVATIDGASSSSIGEEPNRRVVISATGARKPRQGGDRPRSDSRGRGGQGRRPQRSAAPAAPAEGETAPSTREGVAREGEREHSRFDRPQRPAATEVRGERPAKSPAEGSAQGPARATPPTEAQGQPLYGKIELE